MSIQLVYALKKVGIMMALAVLGVAVEYQTDVLQSAGVNELFWPIIAAGLASAVRAFEGYRDGVRAEEGVVIPADVAYGSVTPVATSHGVKYTTKYPTL